MLSTALKLGLSVLAIAGSAVAASADVMHFSVPVSVNQLRLVSQAKFGAVECFVAGYSISPLDVPHARNLKGANYGYGHTGFSLATGSYQGTVNVDVDMGSHTVAEARSWYCAITFDGQYAWGFQHDLSAPYTPETFGNIGSPANTMMQLHTIPH